MERSLKNALFLQNFMVSLTALSDREQWIITHRLLARRKMTLDLLGENLNLTRERVRQLESQLETSLQPLTEDLIELYKSEVSLLAPSGPFACMLGAVTPFGSRSVEATAAGEIDFANLGEKFGLYEIDEGICFVPSKGEVLTRLLSTAEVQRLNKLVRFSEVAWPEMVLGKMSPEKRVRFLELLGLTQINNDCWLESPNYVASAIALLELHDSPLLVEDLRNMIDPGISSRSFRNRLKDSKDFVFTDVDSVRLALPGESVAKLKSITELIEDIVSIDGESVSLAEVVESVQSKRSAAESSIRAYANRYPFMTKQNRVYRTEEDVRRPSQQPCRTRNLFKLPSGWAYRLQINSEHVRGSSITLPMSFVNAMGLDLNTEKEFKDLQSEELLWVRWDGSQPKARSIRRNLVSAGIQAGEWAMLCFVEDTFSIARIANSGKIGAEALAEMFPSLFNLQIEQFLRTVFMCDELGGAPLLEALRTRREFDLVELFESGLVPSP